MRLPNGYGSVYKLSGARRRPYVARLTVGWDENTGYPVYKILGYYSKRTEALEALAAYHKEPWNTAETKVDDVFEKSISRMAESTQRSLRSAYHKWIKPKIGSMLLSNLKLAVAQEVMDSVPNCQNGVRNALHSLERYAMENEYISRPFCTLLHLSEYARKRTRTVLSKEEIAVVMNGDTVFLRLLKVLLYTGMRKTELTTMRTEQYHPSPIPHFIGGIKTKAGKNRIIPIHPDIQKIVSDLAVSSTDGYLVPDSIRPVFYSSQHYLSREGITHTYHEFRHTLRTEMEKAGCNRICIDRIIGHSSGNIGDDVYTHKNLEELYAEILRISFC